MIENFKGHSEKLRKKQLKNYRIDADGCWLWLGTICKDGYGKLKRFGKTIRAHRFFYAEFKGVIEDNNVIMHTCDVPACVNPDHLIQGTYLDNERDKDLKGRRSLSPSLLCPETLPRGESHFKSKLKNDDIFEIRDSNQSIDFLVEKFGVHETTIRKIQMNKIWRHLL